MKVSSSSFCTPKPGDSSSPPRGVFKCVFSFLFLASCVLTHLTKTRTCIARRKTRKTLQRVGLRSKSGSISLLHTWPRLRRSTSALSLYGPGTHRCLGRVCRILRSSEPFWVNSIGESCAVSRDTHRYSAFVTHRLIIHDRIISGFRACTAPSKHISPPQGMEAGSPR